MKIGQIYNLKSFDKLSNSRSFNDAAGGVILSQNLISVDPFVFTKQFPEFSFVNSGIDVDNTGGYARVIESLRITPQGDFADANDEADNKGKISLKGENSFLKVYEKEAFSEWSLTEIKQAEMGNVNLVSKFLEAHNYLYQQKLDELGYLGQDANTGLLNNTYFPTAASSATHEEMTPQQLYDTVAQELINKQWNQVLNTPAYMANVVVMPIQMANLSQSLILNTAAGDKSVLDSLQTNFPSVRFMTTFRTTDKVVAYSTNRQSMVMRIPEPLTVGEIIKKSSFKFEVESKYRAAGLDILEQDAGFILTGLA